MRVLVLRPEPAAARTAERLRAFGHEAALLPLSRAEHAVDAVKAGLAEPHAAIAITSAEVARLFEKIGDALAPHLPTNLFAVGQASADAARKVGFQTVFTAAGDGKGLADLIAAHYRDLRQDPILYLAGNPRTPGFEARLREEAIPFRTVESYRMVPLAPSPAEIDAALLQPVPDAVLLYSRESARVFFDLSPLAQTPGRLHAMRILCMSPNVAAAVPPDVAVRTAIAPAPDEESLLALL